MEIIQKFSIALIFLINAEYQLLRIASISQCVYIAHISSVHQHLHHNILISL